MGGVFWGELKRLRVEPNPEHCRARISRVSPTSRTAPRQPPVSHRLHPASSNLGEPGTAVLGLWRNRRSIRFSGSRSVGGVFLGELKRLRVEPKPEDCRARFIRVLKFLKNKKMRKAATIAADQPMKKPQSITQLGVHGFAFSCYQALLPAARAAAACLCLRRFHQAPAPPAAAAIPPSSMVLGSGTAES